jgi:hypothetical protein
MMIDSHSLIHFDPTMAGWLTGVEEAARNFHRASQIRAH